MKSYLLTLCVIFSIALSAQSDKGRFEWSSDVMGYASQRLLVLTSDDPQHKRSAENIEQAEMPAVLMQCGLYAAYRLAPRIKIKSGLNYAVRGENGVKIESHAFNDPRIGKYHRVNSRNYRLELPVLLQWELSSSECKNCFFLALGPVLSYGISAKSITVNYLDDRKERFVAEDPNIRNMIALGQIAFGYRYNWSDSWSFQTQLILQHALKDNIKDNDLRYLKSYPQGAGLSVGLVYRVN